MKNLDCAYNTAGVGYDDQIDQNLHGALINASEIGGRFVDFEKDFVTNTAKNKESSGTMIDQNGTQCVWVGMVPKNADNYTGPKLKNNVQAPKKGQSILSNKKPLMVPYDQHALKAIVVLTHAMNKYYVFLGNDGKARRVNIDHIFFFEIFRDDTLTAKEKRGETTSKLITEFKSHMTKEKKAPKGEKIAIRAPFHLEQDFTNQVQSLLVTYLRDPRQTYLNSIQDLISKKDAELRGKPMGLESVVAVFDMQKDISFEQASAAVQEMNTMWPPLADLNISPQEIRQLSQGLHEANIRPEYGLMRGFIVEWVRSIRKENPSNLKKLAQETYQFTQLIGSTPLLKVSVRDDQFVAFLDSTIGNLELLVSHGKAYVDTVGNELGRNFSGEGLAEIFQQFAETPDIESAQQWMTEACHFLAMEMAERDKGVMKYLEELIQMLKAFRASLEAK